MTGKLKKLFELFFTFFKIGLFTFGGGYAMISIIEDKCVEKKKWITHDDMMNVTVIAESTPGPIAINCATFVGYTQGGITGSISATLGVVLPSFIIIYLISLFLDSFLDIVFVRNMLKGIKIAVGILIADTGFRMLKSSVYKKEKTNAENKKDEKKPDILCIVCAAASFLVMAASYIFAFRFSTVILLLAAALLSLGAYILKKVIDRARERRKG